MANDLNRCDFIGHLGKAPETRYLASGDAVTNFSLACNWKGKDTEGVEWIRISTFGKLAEICGEYLRTGSQAYVSGRMRTRKWQTKEGEDRYSTEIVADRVQFLGGKKDGETREREEPKTETRAQSPDKRAGGGFDEIGDDIPF